MWGPVKAGMRGCYLIFSPLVYVFVALVLFFRTEILLSKSHSHVSNQIWEKVSPHLLPDQHPVRIQLDQIFSVSRGILNSKSLQKAGFRKSKPRKFTHLIVTTHPTLPGYIFKLYLDSQKYYKKLPEYENWLMRIQGASFIQSEINKLDLQSFFKVPKKWIYDLPEEPSPPFEYLRKNFLLVEEDMALYSEEENNILWQSDFISHAILDGLFKILKNIGLRDCVKIDNIPISKDGKIAFVDTQTYHAWPVHYKELSQKLSKENRAYWKSLINSGNCKTSI